MQVCGLRFYGLCLFFLSGIVCEKHEEEDMTAPAIKPASFRQLVHFYNLQATTTATP